MRRARVELYAHLIWATKERGGLLKQPLRRPLYRCLEDQARKMGCTVRAIGGMPDHVHVVLQFPAKHSISEIVQRLKAASSKFAHDELQCSLFQWQDAYGGFTLSRSHVARVVSYVEGQEAHHGAGRLWAEWEETFEEVGAPPGGADRPPDGIQ